jgi:hypothetical protein
MKHLAPTLLLLLGTATAARLEAPIYRLDDPQRPPEFTDRPPRLALDPVTLGESSAFPDPRPPATQAREAAPRATIPASEAPKDTPPQPTVAIISPSPGEAIRANNGAAPLALALNPALASGEQLRLELDGQTLMTTPSPPPALEGLARGEHTLKIERLSPKGQSLAEATHTFYVLRTALGRAP